MQSRTKALLTALIETHKAGSPTDPSVFWISLRPIAIAKLFYEQHALRVSHGQIKRLLKELGYRYRRQSKQLAIGTYDSALRNQQFNIISMFILTMSIGSPVLSMDCKKKERLGNLYRDGRCYCSASQKVYDHDYEHLSEGKVIPHGIYDMALNTGYLSIGNSAETAAFVVDNLLWWWTEHGINSYPDAKNILLLCDAGGANSYRHHIFKRQLMAFAKETGLSVIVCHYPPYCSKWNPIEHRLFSQVHKAMEGVVFSDYTTVQKAMSHTATKTGLSVVVRLNLKTYPKGLKALKIQPHENAINYHKEMPKLNYRIYP